MFKRTLKPDLAGKIWIFLAVVLLVGILITAYGYFENNRLALYLGLAITLVGVIVGMFRIVISPKG